MKSIVAAVVLLAGLQGLPALVGPLVPDSTGTVMGIIRRSGTGQPIPDARVSVVSRAEANAQTATRGPFTAVTDVNGKFTIKGVTPGLFVLIAEAEGYFSFGETSAATRARKDIAVNESQQTDAGALELVPGAAISGRVAGPDGQPLTAATVQVFQASYVRDRLVFTLARTARTDDLGDYRLFWLPPGEYYVRAQYRTSNDSRSERYGRVYFPGIVDEDAAPPISVSAGAEVSGIDLRVPVMPVSGVKVSGHVISPVDPEAVRVTSVHVVPRDRRVLLIDDADSFPNQAIDASNGQFEIRNVMPGAYNIFPIARDLDGNMRSLPIPVDVVDRDIDNLAAVLDPAIDISGRVTLDGGKPGHHVLNGSIGLVPLDARPGIGKVFPINPDPETGEFVLSHLPPGKYGFESRSFLVPDIYVADIKMGQDSIFDRGFIAGSESKEPLDVTLKSQGGAVSGLVFDASRLRAQLYSTVVLVPDPAHRQNFTLYKHAMSANGNFTFTGVPPGDYKVFAWRSVVPGVWENAPFLQKFEDRGLAVTVATGVEKNVQLTVIP